MPETPLPALDGRDPLGFLAALGTVQLLEQSQLSFNPRTGQAILHSPHTGIGEVCDELERICVDLGDSLLPKVTADLPLQKRGSGPDPMRAKRDQFTPLVDRYRDDPEAMAWLTSLVTDLATDDKGRITLSALMAPAGQQSVGTYFKTALTLIRRDPSHIRDALTNWRRTDNFSGEYLDHRALSSAADHPTGRSTEAGVPGATWLATMALPLFRITGDGKHWRATAWHRPARARTMHMIWPLWRQPLTPQAIQTLLEHPLLEPIVTAGRPVIPQSPDALEELGIFHITGAYRQPIEGRKFAGVLTPQPVDVQAPKAPAPRHAVVL